MGTLRHQKIYAKFMRWNRPTNQWEKSPVRHVPGGEMTPLNRIVHTDNSITTYWRCPECSHAQVTQTPRQLNRDERLPKGSGDLRCIYFLSFPPSLLITRLVQLPMVPAA
jgi:hypothetical protein